MEKLLYKTPLTEIIHLDGQLQILVASGSLKAASETGVGPANQGLGTEIFTNTDGDDNDYGLIPLAKDHQLWKDDQW